MDARGVALTTAVGVVTTWMATPLLTLALGRSLDDEARSRMRAQCALTPWAAVPAPRPAADDVRRVTRVG
jgi:hypothetical protein